MSDDRLLGRICCLPRRYFCILFAALCFFYALIVVVEWILFYYIKNASMTPLHCSGHHCFQIVTCKGMQETTFKIRNIVVIGGGLLLSWQGVLGGMNSAPQQTKVFALYLLAVVASYVFGFIADVIFASFCDMWPYNVIDLVVMLPFPFSAMEFPVARTVRDELYLMTSWPIDDVWQLTDIHVSRWYCLMVGVLVLWWYYAFDAVYMLSKYFACGTSGLGPNFDLLNWQERVNIKREVGQFLGHTHDMAKNTYGSALTDTYNATLGDGNAFEERAPPPPAYTPVDPVWQPVERGMWINGMLPDRPLPVHRDVLSGP